MKQYLNNFKYISFELLPSFYKVYKQANKQTNKQTNKQNKQTNKQTNRRTNKQHPNNNVARLSQVYDEATNSVARSNKNHNNSSQAQD